MYQTIPAVYEHGIFRPLKKISLKEHQKLLLRLQIPKEDYETLLENLEILNDQKQLDRIHSALQEVKKGKTFSHSDIFGRPQPNRKESYR